MAQVIPFPNRPLAAKAQLDANTPALLAKLERTPELALIMALLSAMPISTRKKVLNSINTLRNQDPYSHAALAAQFVAAQLIREG